jgi:catechol 2,3-dioxygenase-like lactoylglutathione lyase family enzyme
MPEPRVLGRFHEISIHTPDIGASVEFYESLGFSQATTGDTWPHPYGVVTDGRIVLGLHQYRFPSPAITFVKADIAAQVRALEALGLDLAFARTGDETFNELGLRDPAGQMLTLLEARTYSPFGRSATEVSLCGDFAEFSIPTPDFDASRGFWEALGFVALESQDSDPYPRLPLTSDFLDLAFHRPRTLEQPMLVFHDVRMDERLAALRARGLAPDTELPRGLPREQNGLLWSPEGTALLLLTREP